MGKAQYAILRFSKYKGPAISHIEAHDERTKDTYASNPDVDLRKSHLNFHLVTPERHYRAEAERQIAAAGCRVRSDSVRVVETLVTASPEFFRGKNQSQVKAFFQEALNFLSARQNPATIISAVVHMDEKTPHMHLSFVPITADGRLCAKEIIGNRQKLTKWQDGFWEHMVKKFPELERGESASTTGREHIPTRVFKQMARLTKQKGKLETLLNGANYFNAKSKIADIEKILDSYIPDVEKMATEMKKYSSVLNAARQDARELREENVQLSAELRESQSESVQKQLHDYQLQRDYEEAVKLLDRIPPEIREAYRRSPGRKPDKERV